MYCQSFVVLCAVVSLQLHLIPALVLGQPLQNLLSPFGSGLNAGGLLNSGAGIIAGGGVLPGSGLSGYGSVCNLQPNVASFLYGQLNRQLGFQSNFPYIQPNQYRILGLAPSLSSPNNYMSAIQLSNGACQGLEFGFNRAVNAGPFCSIYNAQPIACGLIQPSSYCAEFTVLNILPVVVVEAPVVEEPVVEEPIVEEPIYEEPIVEEPIYEEPAVVDVEPEVIEPIAVRSLGLGPEVIYQKPGCSQNVQVSIVHPGSPINSGIVEGVGEIMEPGLFNEVVQDVSDDVLGIEGEQLDGAAVVGRGVRQIIDGNVMGVGGGVNQVVGENVEGSGSVAQVIGGGDFVSGVALDPLSVSNSQQSGCSQNVQVSFVQPVIAAAPAVAAEVPEVVSAPVVEEVASPVVFGIPNIEQPVRYGPICYPQRNFVSSLYGRLNPLFGVQSSYSYIQPNQYKILGLAPSLNYPNQYMCPIQLSNGACHSLEIGLQGGFSAGSYSSISSVLPIQCPSVQAPICGFSF